METGVVFKVTMHSDGLTQLPSSSLLNLDSTTAFRLRKILLKAQDVALATRTLVAILPVAHSS